MSEIVGLVVVFCAVFLTVIIMFGGAPNSERLAKTCAERGRVQQVVWSTFAKSATVICRDGTVHTVRRP